MDTAFDAVVRGLDLRQRVRDGHGQAPCRPPEPPRQDCYEGASTAGMRTFVCTMGPWAKGIYVSRELERVARIPGMELEYLKAKTFRQLALVNAVVREDRDF